ncbi:hypothetical protein [Mesorhizobium sp. B2-5-7]|uniref:hypothetical protein n=1 Tax=Mesorhizobium sp. B2-5-7 TaxID=2589923 RepID=UPI00112AC56D|nr:hypothetical protein [Mesorhizobium sp. B2-5-7]TPK10444.1 hypothetical protein FJ543_23445 [Mesorhizobium sp. B2-5-7]
MLFNMLLQWSLPGTGGPTPEASSGELQHPAMPNVEVMTGSSVVSSTMVMAKLPFKAAEAQAGQPVMFRRQEENWLRVTELKGERRTFAYVIRQRL